MGNWTPELVRKDFPILNQDGDTPPLIYLDTAATAHKPTHVIEAMSEFYRRHYATVHRAVYPQAAESTERYQGVRDLVRRFIGAEHADEIVFTRGATDSINLVASSFGKAFVSEGDEVLITEMEHHSNILPWQELCRERGAILKFLPIDDQGELRIELLQELLTDRTKLVSVVHLSNTLGTINPIKKIVELAHQRGAKVLVDGAQSVSDLQVDVQDLGCDFFVFSGHKLYGPTGVGVLYGKRDILNQLPPYQTGGSMIRSVSMKAAEYEDAPTRFEAGTPMIAEVIGLGAALEYLNRLGMQRVHEQKLRLLHFMEEELQAIPGLRVLGSALNKASVCSFVIDGVHPLDMGTMLGLRGIAVRTGHHCTQPIMERFGLEGSLRASLGVYSTQEDIEQFIQHLKELSENLRPKPQCTS